MVGELEGLITEMSSSLIELGNLQEKIENQSSKKESLEEQIKSVKKEFEKTNLKENKLTQKRYNSRLVTFRSENKKIKDNIKELKSELNEKYEKFHNEFGRKLSLRKKNFEDFFVLSEESKERRKEQIKVLEESIKRDEKNGVSPKAEYLINRKKLLENYKASLDEENREKDLDMFINLEKIFNSSEDIKSKINNLKVLIGNYNEKNNSNKPVEKPIKESSETDKQVQYRESEKNSVEKPANESAEMIENNEKQYSKSEKKSISTPKKSIWTKMKGKILKVCLFIKEKISNTTNKVKTFLTSRKNKQLKSSEMSAYDMAAEMVAELDNKSKNDFRTRLKVNSNSEKESEKIADKSPKEKDNTATKDDDKDLKKLLEDYFSI